MVARLHSVHHAHQVASVASHSAWKSLGYAAALAAATGVLVWLRRQQVKSIKQKDKCIGDFKLQGFDVSKFCAALERKVAGFKFRCKPFLVGWYNAKRDETSAGSQKIDAADNALAIIMYTVPGYLDIIADNFQRQKPQAGFVDDTTKALIDCLKEELDSELGAIVLNTDQGPPYYHVQTIGAIAGIDQHVEPTEIKDQDWEEELSDELEVTRDTKIWGTDKEMLRKIFGVNIHPEYGGWYAFRIMLILPEVHVAPGMLQQPAVLEFLSDDEKKRMLWEYNLDHQACRWRDLDNHSPEKRYTPEEYFFFTEQNQEKRKRFLEMKVEAAGHTM
eukprot:gnl/MRDRNA2_/MRDRNA2_108490_c0_seq1.p1 gnl/MRDRNA2_/MRDRNA2_108490_c0~~gnl/MRDRNA2_/MRDRNA2_108490_c0_seq1.p1  ORF type:complete len:332 (+),score=72.16 gnl/MRDRNA2_/MRDRNA2_108490_c0_seq1:46-1041(+)